MADKEATVYIVDMGVTMRERPGGRATSNLDWAMEYVWDKITTTVAASRKTWTVGVLGLRTDETRNPLQDEEGYDNITVLQAIEPMSLTSLRTLHGHIQPSNTTTGDAVSAVIVATDMIGKAAPKRLKFTRKIVLVTDGQGPIDGDDFDDLARQINDLGIQLVVVGVNFDDADYGFKEEGKPRLKAKNEKLLRTLVDKCDNGIFGTLAEAIDEIGRPSVKAYRPYRTYEGPLTLGDPETYESALSMNVERYFLTKLARPPPASTVVVSAEDGETQRPDERDDVEMGNVDFAAVRSTRVYTVDDPTAPGGKREVDFDSLEKGYEYGRTAVYISESDRNITQLETTKSFSIVGFVTHDSAQPYLNMGESCIILPRKFSEIDEIAFSALVHAMDDTRTCAVARFVAKDMKEPSLLLLIPTVSKSLVCLYDVPLPFSEDVRTYPFPPLDKVITANGTVLKKHRLLPSDDLDRAMSDYVDAMDLSMFGTDEDGQPAEYAALDDNYSPIIYRVNKALAFRAVNPNKPYVHQDNDFVTRFDHPPAGLVDKARTQIDALIRAADVKKVPPKAKGRAGRDARANKPISGLDIDALLGSEPTVKKEGQRWTVSPDNAIPEFKQALAGTTEVEQIADLLKQMGRIVESLIATSTGDVHYARAAENLRVMREEMIGLEEPALYNTFLTDLKARLAADELGGPRLDMWWTIRTTGLGLITKSESDESDVDDETARETFSAMAGSTFYDRVCAAYDLNGEGEAQRDGEAGGNNAIYANERETSCLSASVDGGNASSAAGSTNTTMPSSGPITGFEVTAAEDSLAPPSAPPPSQPRTNRNAIYVPFDPEDQSDDEVIVTSAYERQNGISQSNKDKKRRRSHKTAAPSTSTALAVEGRGGPSSRGGNTKNDKPLSGAAFAFHPKPADVPATAVLPLVNIPGDQGKPRPGLERGSKYTGNRVKFCPWKMVMHYHKWFVGKTNGERIQPYFETGALLKCQTWDFCYLWNQAKGKTDQHVIVVPTEQFQHFLDRLNQTLRIQLTIPVGVNAERFRVSFGQQGTPLPRFLGHASDANTFEALVKTMPSLDPADNIHQMSRFKPQAQTMYLKKVKGLLCKYDKTDSKKHKADKAQKKRALARRTWGKQAKRIQRYLGLRGKADFASRGVASDSNTKELDLTKPVPFSLEEDVIFVSMDLESYEYNHGAITEIGFGILDTRDVQGVPPGDLCKSWHALIRGRHIRIREHVSMVNRVFVHGYENNFNFGTTEFVSLKDVVSVITAVLQPTLPTGELRKVVLVGHDINSDISLVKNVGFDVHNKEFLEILDTQDLHQHFQMRQQQSSLRGLLNDLEIEHNFLHNGGNDAVYTLQAMVSLIVSKRQASLRRQNERLRADYKPEPVVVEEGWDTGGEMSDGGYAKPSNATWDEVDAEEG
ncbi:ku family DNA-binding protein [Niveomyces insectorum RCEF 264]|uniref:ATP-dependent DNA helicase II subunit 2 n=1 Tax=Niveomyces insectorum RCEF 264 TaxID=1081102 RepID=A0A167RFC6_9HYPO|nr:ku family DNA-binding protein [Niveomyces insectorum RCEF 264]